MELWDIYDKNKKPTGRTMKRNDWHLKDGEYHLTVLGVVAREDGTFLITKRVMTKAWAPGWWEVSGGAAQAGEASYDAVLREVKEETGLDVSNAQGGYLFTYKRENPGEGDNYFVERVDTPKDENGQYNFECLEAMDIELFNQQMSALLRGEEVYMPTFNFITGTKEYKGNSLKLGPEDVLVIEGIHCLNDALSYSLPAENKFKIYVSALTQMNIDEHNRIPTTDGRLLRRMVRDARTRGASAQKTISMWPSVRRGEDENIFPYQESADVVFNSALIYELSVLKQYAEPLLFGIKPEEPEYLEAKRLLKFLNYFQGIDSNMIPGNSILREFIGGSFFNV